MRPKGKLLALFALFAAVGLITATGAFTTVQADRTADISVAGDSAALITFEPADQNGQYVDDTGNGEYSFNLSHAGFSAEGVNLNATTTIDRTINISNNGGNIVDLWIETSGGNVQYVSFHNGTSYGNTDNITGQSNSMSLASTDGNVTISVQIDTTGSSTGLDSTSTLIDTITIHAEAQ